jgi:hypothetical protein
MGILNMLNKKKCEKVWNKVTNLLHDQDKCIISLSTMKGYDEFFKRVINAGYIMHIDDSMRESIFVTIEKKEKEIKYVN